MAELLKDIQTYWDMRAGGFSDASMEERKTEPGKHWENIFRNSLEEGCTVLDDGCGAGFFTTLLASMGYQVTAVDYSPKMLEEVRKNLDAENLNINKRANPPYLSQGNLMPALRRATVSTRLTATEVSSIRLHSSWSPPSMALAKAWNSAACRGLPPFRLKCSSLP